MATAESVISAAAIDPALLAALKAAIPDQLGDDLVLRLPDGRVFYIDGFFAADEIGDGQAPAPDAIALARDIADLLLGAEDIATAAGDPELPPPPASSGTGFIPFDGDVPQGLSLAPADPGAFDNDDDTVDARDLRAVDRLRDRPDYNSDNFEPVSTTTTFPRFGGGGLAPIGSVSMSAGSLASPTFPFSMNLADLITVHQLKDPAYDGWFPGMMHVLPIGPAYDFATLKTLFTAAADPDFGAGVFDYYVLLHGFYADYVAGRNVWMADGNPNGVHSNQTGAGLAQHFNGDDIIFGTSFASNPSSNDTLRGYDGNDILIAYDGQNDLDGGSGNDILIVTQPVTVAAIGNGTYPPLHNIAGGTGYDKLVLQLKDGGYLIDTRLYPKTITSIEALEISIYPANFSSNLPWVPPFVVTDQREIAMEGYPPVILLDAAVVAEWGGTLTIDAVLGRVHLTDLPAWTREADDPARPGYALYSAEHNGVPVSLAIANTLAQPIDGAISGTAGNDELAWIWRSFTSYDGGPGDDTITTKMTPYVTAPSGLGSLDLVGPTTPVLHNIEIIHLVAGDELILSAADVAAVTDVRNTLWVTSDFAVENNPAAGKLTMTDADSWQSLGYVSLVTDISQSVPIHRTGALFAAHVNGETVQMFVSVGIELPADLDTENLHTWSIWNDGIVPLPPPGFVTDLDTIDFGSGVFSKTFTFSLDEAQVFAGVDGRISIVTDDIHDVVSFADPGNWTLTGVERDPTGPDFYLYTGHDGTGNDVTLRLQTDLIEPLPDLHPTVGDDFLVVAEVIPDYLDGGAGFDRLQILGADAELADGINFAAMDNRGPAQIEVLDLHNDAKSRLLLDSEAVARLSGNDVLYIVGEGEMLDQVFLQDIGNWSRTGVISAPQVGATEFVRYEADTVFNGVATHLTIAVAGDLIQPFGEPLL
ncbi:hypothetical protein [Dongia mobilis]|uniref:hypothetical protein n=1 Tax=Dongia sp. TaxID=1977262 RepID=UPI0026F000E9